MARREKANAYRTLLNRLYRPFKSKTPELTGADGEQVELNNAQDIPSLVEQLMEESQATEVILESVVEDEPEVEKPVDEPAEAEDTTSGETAKGKTGSKRKKKKTATK